MNSWLCLALWAISADPVAPTTAFRLTVTEVHDADTFRATIHLPLDIDLPNRPVRAYGYDAWEINRVRQTVQVTDAEIAKGKTAKADFEALLRTGQLWGEDSGERDPYGRVSLNLWFQTSEGIWVWIPSWMRKRGHHRGVER